MTATDFRGRLLTLKRRAQALVFLGHDQMGQAMRAALGILAQFYTVGTITG